MTQDWLKKLRKHVDSRPLIILRFNSGEWEALHDSRKGASEFTFARSHVACREIKKRSMCLILGEGREYKYAYFGLIGSRAAVTTLDTRIKVKRAVRITPITGKGLLALITQPSHKTNLQKRLKSGLSVIPLSPKLSMHLIEKLADIDTNRGPLRAVAEYLESPKYYNNAGALQEDAVQAALKVFGISVDDQAESLELVAGQKTALARVNIMEDAVIEHDARHVPGYSLINSNVTGRAVFKKGEQELEVFTANRRSLEKVLGVDLIYFNATRKNVVMLQYKMLEARRDGEESVTDWIYQPDKQLKKEMQRMEQFFLSHMPGKHEYRLNPQVYYLKFVKRDGALGGASIITPIDHFKMLQQDPECKGKRGSFKISYNTLGGRYLRQGAFMELVYSGYIGAHGTGTAQLRDLVDAILKDGRAVVAAVQTARTRRNDG